MITEAIYKALLFINLLLIVASFWFGSKLIRPYRIALLLTAIGLGVMLYALVSLLNAPELPGYLLGIKILIVVMIPLLTEFIVLLWIYRKRFRGR